MFGASSELAIVMEFVLNVEEFRDTTVYYLYVAGAALFAQSQAFDDRLAQARPSGLLQRRPATSRRVAVDDRRRQTSPRGRRRRLGGAGEHEAAATLVDLAVALLDDVVVLELAAQRRQRLADRRLLSHVRRETVRHALTHAVAVPDAAQPLTLVRTCAANHRCKKTFK